MVGAQIFLVWHTSCFHVGDIKYGVEWCQCGQVSFSIPVQNLDDKAIYDQDKILLVCSMTR
jgi:hypothetical protein